MTIDFETGRCSVCGSRYLTVFEAEYPTGVTAPDGGVEMHRQTYVRCRNCGVQEEL